MKVAVIGGGSTYTPELVSGLSAERERIGDVTELVLHDVDAERREVVGGMARRMLDRQAFAGSLEVTDDLDQAVEGRRLRPLQIRVGGRQHACRTRPCRSCVAASGGETTGAGRFAKALRTVPVVLTSPTASASWPHPTRGSSTSRTRRDRHPRTARPRPSRDRPLQRRDRTAALGCAAARGRPGRVLVDQVGLNHLTWVRELRVDGEDVLPRSWPSAAPRSPPASAREALVGELGVIPSLLSPLLLLPRRGGRATAVTQ
jgi:6-phospho-beta-glucosidase